MRMFERHSGEALRRFPDGSPTSRPLAYIAWEKVHATGLAGTMYHWNGATWSSVAGVSNAFLSGISGRSADDVWAVGEGGTILHRGRR